MTEDERQRNIDSRHASEIFADVRLQSGKHSGSKRSPWEPKKGL